MISKQIHRLFSYTGLYLATQKAFGAHRLRRLCVDVLAPRSGERILDLGCGPAYILDYLPRVEYYGFDTERSYIDYAGRKYAGRGSFYCEPFTAAHAEQMDPFDGILFMGLLHHLSDGECQDILDLASRALKPNGRIVTLDPCYVRGQSRVARFVASHDRGRYVRDEMGYSSLAGGRFSLIERTVVHNVGRLPSTEIIMRLSMPRC